MDGALPLIAGRSVNAGYAGEGLAQGLHLEKIAMKATPSQPNHIAVGSTVGDLTVVALHDVGPRGGITWLCACRCGEQLTVPNCHLTVTPGRANPQRTTCGKHQSTLEQEVQDRNSKLYSKYPDRQKSRSRLYGCWMGMRSRVLNEKADRFKSYGGRGIKLHPAWLTYENFRQWAVSNGYRDDLTLDRKDVNGDYTPDNCRWATKAEQANNKQCSAWIEAFGERKTTLDWAKDDRCVVDYYTLRSRRRRG